MAQPDIDLSRRRFLLRKPAEEISPVRPPWLNDDLLIDLCSRCDACGAACPQHIVRRGDGGFPVIDFTAGDCTFCGACAQACPEPALFRLIDTTPWRLAPHIKDGCLAAAGVFCQSCGDACPERAIRFRPTLRGAPHPIIDAEACTGCGACVAACPAATVEVRPA